ncbi:hypothetical protein RD149_06605 [Gordonia westfalica]|uniref:Uncharacterized protein n=1 Tax=Gordonia westfalica TaxID=158898 RepID=A0ABU2GR50_9ACTN|nr:hypothetical protein [Gordonia westfalica]MDS1113434.1 hypothetical protein [Gordonia westfalica]
MGMTSDLPTAGVELPMGTESKDSCEDQRGQVVRVTFGAKKISSMPNGPLTCGYAPMITNVNPRN